MKYWHYVAIAYTPQHVQCGELASVFETPNRTHAEMAFHQAAEQVAIQLTRIDGIPEKAYFSIRAFSLIEQDDLEPPAQASEAPEISAELSGLLSSMPYHYEPVMDSVAIRESHIRRSLSRAMSQANSDRLDSDIKLFRQRPSLMETIVSEARTRQLYQDLRAVKAHEFSGINVACDPGVDDAGKAVKLSDLPQHISPSPANYIRSCKGCGYSMDLQQWSEVDGECPQCGLDESMVEP